MQHPDFYTVATTAVLVFMLGGIYLIGTAQAAGSRGLGFKLLYVVFPLPGWLVIMISLGALSGWQPDTPTVRALIFVLVLTQSGIGAGGLLAQYAIQHHVRR